MTALSRTPSILGVIANVGADQVRESPQTGVSPITVGGNTSLWVLDSRLADEGED